MLLPANSTRWDSFTATWDKLFGVDLRALAALRIALAGVLIVDILQRFATIDWFLTDELFFTRDLSQRLTRPDQGFWSLYWLSGSSAATYVLLVVNLLAAIGLGLGFKTRIATCLCLVLAWSLQVRMPLVLTAGHVLLRLLLVWLIFLPCGRVWSLDARRQSPPSSWRVVSIATAGLLLQVAMMYLFSGIAKWNEVWLRGDAIYLAMQLDMYVKPWGRNLLAWPQLCAGLTWGTLLLEIAGPLLLFMPVATRKLRATLCVAFYGLHLGIWLALSAGIFPLVAMVAWIPLWPAEVWSARRGRSPSQAHRRDPLPERTTPEATIPAATSPAATTPAATSPAATSPAATTPTATTPAATIPNLLPSPPLRGRGQGEGADRIIDRAPTRKSPHRTRIVQLAAICVLVYTIAINTANIDPVRSQRWFPPWARYAGNALMLTQEFKMFERPSPWNYAWRLARQETSGSWIDAFGGSLRTVPQPSTWPKPPEIYSSFPGHAWRRLFFNLAYYGEGLAQPDPLLWELRNRLGTAVAAQWTTSTRDSPAQLPTPNGWQLIRLRRSLESWGELEPPHVEVWYRE